MRRLLLLAIASACAAAVGCGGGPGDGAAGAASCVVVSNRGGAWRLYEVDRGEGGGARLVGSPRADGPAYADAQPARLPDGSIVFTSDRGGSTALYRCDRGGSEGRPLFTSDAAGGGTADSDPAPCGADRIVFARGPMGTGGAPGSGTPGGGANAAAAGRDLYRAGRDGGGLRRLTRDPADDGAPCALPDGRTIVFASERPGTRRLFRLDADADDPEATVTPLLPAAETLDDAPACLPDGSILFERTAPGGRSQVFQIRFGAQGPVARQITDAATLPYGAGEPVPLADGTILLTAGPGPASSGPRYAVYGISGGGYNLARVTRERAGYEDLTRRLRPLR
jgi:hypothetical protein